MSEPVKRPYKRVGPLAVIEVGEPPEMQRGPKKVADPWLKVIRQVRELGGRSAKICHHPKAKDITARLRASYPDIVFVTRTIQVGEKTTTGIWARLNTAIPDPPPIPEQPSVNALTDPELG